ncbi:MAG: extracellular solute-binding protein [Chloroflexota bacterium]
MARTISRRRFLGMMGATGSAALLAACGGATPASTPAPSGEGPAAEPGAPAPSGQAVTLNVLWENWGEIYNNLMTVIGEQFTSENPNIALEWNFDPDWVTKLTTLIAANTLPDITVMRSGPLATMAPRGALMPLDDVVKEAGFKREDFVTPLWDSAVVDGKLYALPGGADYFCLFYSKDVYREVGLDPEQPPRTFDELIAHSREILQKDASGDIQRIGYNPSEWHFRQWAFIHGGKFYDPNTGKITANDPANVAVLEKLAAYVKELDINKLAAFNQRPGTYEAGNPFSTKQAAFIFDGFWTFEALDQHAPDIDYGVAYWPTVTGAEEERANYMIDGWQVSIPAGGQHAAEAALFIRYAFIEKSAEMGYQTLNGTCVRSQFGAWEEGVRAKMGADNRMAPHLSKFTDTGGVATNFFPALPVTAFYQDELNRVYDLVMRGEMTPQAGLDEVTKNVQAELDKALSS